MIGPFDLGTYKKKEDDSKSLDELIVHDSDERISDARAGAERGAIIGEAINLPAGWPMSRGIYFHPVDWRTRPWR